MRWKLAGVAVLAAGGLLGAAYLVDQSRGVTQATLGPTTPVVVHAPGGDLRTTAEAMGLTVDEAASRRALEDAESGGPADWLRGLLARREAPLVTRIDEAKVHEVVRSSDPTTRRDPVEPSIVGTEDGIEVEDGRPGRGLDSAAVAVAVRDAARHAGDTVEVDVAPVRLPPRHTRADAEALADRARRLTDGELTVTTDGGIATVGSATVRSWLRSTDDLELDLADEEVLEDLARELDEVVRPAEDATISIQGGVPVIVRGVVGLRCCGESTPDAVLEALEDERRTVSVPLEEVQPDRTSADLERLRITEQIGTFTTRYPAGQSRVRNIHRIAEIVDGTLIGPGGRFSVNDKVGERTEEKGFVLGGVIQDGSFSESIGGGISQFATTLFNAAFFGGLDIPAYQSHSIYISRYPYGREATLSWPKPDLVIANTTPYGVFVDTSVTSTSVTVTLYSTRHATGEQTNQSESPVGACKRVKTERTRRYVDGTTKVDNFFATYRPAEGVRC